MQIDIITLANINEWRTNILHISILVFVSQSRTARKAKCIYKGRLQLIVFMRLYLNGSFF